MHRKSIRLLKWQKEGCNSRVQPERLHLHIHFHDSRSVWLNSRDLLRKKKEHFRICPECLLQGDVCIPRRHF